MIYSDGQHRKRWATLAPVDSNEFIYSNSEEFTVLVSEFQKGVEARNKGLEVFSLVKLTGIYNISQEKTKFIRGLRMEYWVFK